MTKYPKLVVAVIVVLGIAQSAPIARAQSARDQNYARLFAVSKGFFAQLPNVCKTAACAQIALDGTRVVADGTDKYARGVLAGNERIAFHKNLEAALFSGIAEMRPLLPSNIKIAQLMNPTQVKCLTVGQTETTACQGCYDAYEVLAEICALYTIVSPSAALICLGAATIGFGRCVLDNCQDIPQ